MTAVTARRESLPLQAERHHLLRHADVTLATGASARLYEPSGLAGGGRMCRIAWASAIARRATVADNSNSGFEDERDDHRPAAELAPDVGPKDSPSDLLQLFDVVHALGERVLQSIDDARNDLVEH